ncbi:MAG: tyrosine-type recombinase/integrase [candidate division NC10 bacterium]|nr:tyrosine-type recombinase/integrase [candidate division NC10 bacterium]
MHPAAAFAYVTGWRKQEVLGLTWDRVDLQAGIVRLEPGSTKNGDGRTVVLPEPLREVLAQLWQEVRKIATTREIAQHVPWVFLRHGQRIRNFRRA